MEVNCHIQTPQIPGLYVLCILSNLRALSSLHKIFEKKLFLFENRFPYASKSRIYEGVCFLLRRLVMICDKCHKDKPIYGFQRVDKLEMICRACVDKRISQLWEKLHKAFELALIEGEDYRTLYCDVTQELDEIGRASCRERG